VLDPEVVEGAIADARAELRPSADAVAATAAALEAELRQVEYERQRYVDAIAKAGDLTVLVKALNERDDRCAELQRELAAWTGRRQRASVTNVDQIVRDLRKRLDDWRRTLRRHGPIARQILLRLIV
jgi:hypothetical protein